MIFNFHTGILACVMMMSTAQADDSVSHFPKKDLGRFLAEHFDLTSIRSSLGPRRSRGMHTTFADLGMQPSRVSENFVVFESPNAWLYEMKIVGRRDVNGDGIEDLVVCFLDRALNGGTHDSSQGLLVTRYSAGGYAIALSFSPGEGGCEDYAR